MRIALTHNLQRTGGEEEAEFDTPQTIAALTRMLQDLGHEVDRVDVGIPVNQLVDHLRTSEPDLVFNTAEGRHGRFREAFYPALFDELRIPYTGSDAYTCALTLDKQLTKMAVAAAGVLTPRWIFADAVERVWQHDLRFPCIVKPNFEGSSKGITAASIVSNQADLETQVAETLLRYPAGVLVEEFIVGRDVTVPYLEGTCTASDGVLPPAEYSFHLASGSKRKFEIYDFRLKQELSDAVEVRVPASVSDALHERLVALSLAVVRSLGIRDMARMDYRIDEDGNPWFLEVNALPSFEPGASLYLSAKAAGLGPPKAVLNAVITSAVRRRRPRQTPHPATATKKTVRRPPRVALTYNLKRTPPSSDGDDGDAEYDSPATVAAIAAAIEANGCEVVPLEAVPTLVDELPKANVDVAFNIAEGLVGRSREAQVPALLELLGIPYTGSDPATLALTLDKALAKQVVSHAGVATPEFCTLRSPPTRVPKGMTFPLIVKPVAEGSSKGVVGTSVVHDLAGLQEAVAMVVARYQQPALVEVYVGGREFTVGLLGGGTRPAVLPPLEIVFLDPAVEHPVYSFAHKIEEDAAIRYDAPAQVSPALARSIGTTARRAFAALGCRDVARVDLRLDDAGRVHFIECNPLPGLTPDFSDLCLIGKAAGMSYEQLIGRILAPALRRAGISRRVMRSVSRPVGARARAS